MVASPCQGICRLDENDWCIGCRRTLEEIADWPMLNDDEKREILVRREDRKPQ